MCSHPRARHFPVYPGYCQLELCKCPMFIEKETLIKGKQFGDRDKPKHDGDKVKHPK